MTKAQHHKRAWDTVAYQQIVSASYTDGKVVVEFADGSKVSLAPSLLTSPDWPELDWSNLRAEDFHLVVPSPVGTLEFEIPWDIIRVHSDPAFDAFWSQLAAMSVR